MLIAFIGVISVSALREADLGFAGTILAGAGIGGASVLVGLLGRHLSMTGRKQRAVLRAHQLANDTRPPVLYLRSFADDEKVAEANVVDGFIQLSTEEEQFAKVLTRIGPFVAIGDPREKLPVLGATRHYVRDDEWRQDVEETLYTARLVVLRLSTTKGVLWELREAITRLEPARLLLLVPRDQPYPLLKAAVDQWLPRPLPELPNRRMRMGSLYGVVWFHDDWAAQFLRMRLNLLRVSIRAPIAPHLQIALRPVFERLGVKWSKPPLGVFPVTIACMWAAILVGVVVALLTP
jgi:hypothetical protein